MANKYSHRVDSIRAIMREKGWDAVVITGSDPHSSEYPASRWKQVEWVSGFTGEAGDLVITLDHAGLWTDTRYFIQADKQLSGSGIELHKMKVPEQIPIPQWLADYAFVGIDKTIAVAVDGLAQTISAVDEIRDAFIAAGRVEDDEEGFKIVNAPDMLDVIWIDRPSVPQTPIITLGADIVGESREDKILWLRSFLADRKCDAILLTALDEIAWTLNVRGSDVEYNPVVMSYLLVSMDEVVWYVRKSAKIDEDTKDTFDELKSAGVEILAYDDVELSVAGKMEDGVISKLYADPSTLNYNLNSVISSCPEGVCVVYGKSPVPLRKAIKNDVEIAGMREAHLEDGLAMERFLYWLERSVKSGDLVSEWDASEKLTSLRAEIPGYRGNSFETISAYGENAALPHYVTPQVDAPLLQASGLYLNDSGGQYLFGTTDITRTVPLGPCTALEREDYTLVLRGHIDLAMAVFPKGTAGCQIDLLARNPLWQAKRNFGHGTGHGIGFFLNVHEGPQEIRQNFNPQAILPGMINSDEPGIYREGRHGVRHESLMLCVEAGTNDFGTWLKFENLTLCHIDTSIIVKELMTPQEIKWLNDYNEKVYRTLSGRLSAPVAEWLREKTLPI